MNLPEFGCFPGVRIIKQHHTNGRCLKEALSLTKLHNQALSKQLMKLEKQLKGFKYSLYDLNSCLRQRVNHPSKYGKCMPLVYLPLSTKRYFILIV